MRPFLSLILLAIPGLAFAQADEDRISYVCDHDNVVTIVTFANDKDRIVLDAFSRERTLKKTADAPDYRYVGEGYDISFTDLNRIALTSQGATMTCNIDTVE